MKSRRIKKKKKKNLTYFLFSIINNYILKYRRNLKKKRTNYINIIYYLN